MRVGFLSLSLILVVFASAPGGLAFTTPVAVVQSQQPRNQTQPQQGLSPNQKQNLTKIGPEDVFGPTGDESRRQSSTPRAQRKPAPTPDLPPSRPARQSATPVREPLAQQPSSAQPSTPVSSPTIAAPTLAVGAHQSALSQDDSPGKIPTKWAATILIGMFLVVSLALIFTLTKLVEKIKEGSSG
jgi:cytoskeletal protein RodZ